MQLSGAQSKFTAIEWSENQAVHSEDGRSDEENHRAQRELNKLKSVGPLSND
jgi:hypothetical protein